MERQTSSGRRETSPPGVPLVCVAGAGAAAQPRSQKRGFAQKDGPANNPSTFCWPKRTMSFFRFFPRPKHLSRDFVRFFSLHFSLYQNVLVFWVLRQLRWAGMVPWLLDLRKVFEQPVDWIPEPGCKASLSVPFFSGCFFWFRGDDDDGFIFNGF